MISEDGRDELSSKQSSWKYNDNAVVEDDVILVEDGAGDFLEIIVMSSSHSGSSTVLFDKGQSIESIITKIAILKFGVMLSP